MLLVESCQQPEEKTTVTAPITPAVFSIEGLWSKDSAGLLTNHGYLFSSDGTFQEIGSVISGTWQMPSMDSIMIYDQEHEHSFLLKAERQDMIKLTDSNQSANYRRVPFGMNEKPDILNGFSGTLSSFRPDREYQVQIPPCKMVEILLHSEDTLIGFVLTRARDNIITKPVRNWKSVLVNGGEFKLTLMHNKPGKLTADGSEYDLKVMAY